MNVHEMAIMSEAYARVELKKQEKHLKAYLKGRSHYTYHGREFPVITSDLFANKEEEE